MNIANAVQCTALVVDNDPAITELLSCILEDSGVRVLSARNGTDAVALLAAHPVDVVIADIQSQGISGFGIANHTRQSGADIKVILMADTDRIDDVKRALKAGIFGYWNKRSFDHDEIISTVQSAHKMVRENRENAHLIERLNASNERANITNQRLLTLNRQLRTLANTDSLTELYNRRYIDDWIQNHAFSNSCIGASYSVLLLDIDHFKSINDSYGHDGGDKVLKHLADILKQVNRETSLVGRYGGEEFIIVMPVTDECQALHAAEQIRATIQATRIAVRSGTVSVTASIGVSTNQCSKIDFDSTPEEALLSGRALLAQADKALYAAKDRGRNMCLHHNWLPAEYPDVSRAA